MKWLLTVSFVFPISLLQLPGHFLLPLYGGTVRAAYQGFGAATPGGSRGDLVRVTNLNDSGPGSLRKALSLGNRNLVFDVGGEIDLLTPIYIKGSFVTIDGFTAPFPGVTLRGHGLYVRGDRGARDVIVRGIRIRNAAKDGIQLARSAYNIVIDHVSVSGSGDGNIDITHGAHDVTVSWSILGPQALWSTDGSVPIGKNMLIGYHAARITLHHNLFVKNKGRNPYISNDHKGTPAPHTTVDMRNNTIWGWGGGSGTTLRYGAKANVVNNFYSSDGGDKEDALIACTGSTQQAKCADKYPRGFARAYITGNFDREAAKININALGNQDTPFPAPFVDSVEACAGAHQVIARAGLRPLDAIDQTLLKAIVLPYPSTKCGP